MEMGNLVKYVYMDWFIIMHKNTQYYITILPIFKTQYTYIYKM